MRDNNLIKLVKKTLLAMLRDSVGTKMFQHTYVRRKNDSQELDTAQDGQFSCAFYVSGVLAIFGLTDRAHSVVPTTVEKLKEAGWIEITEPKAGAVAVWPEFDGHEHIGFVLNNEEYVSSSWAKRTPQIHKQQLSDGRIPKAYYWHPALDQD